MRYQLNFRPEPFQGYTEFDELDLFEAEAGGWQGEVSRSSPQYIRWVQQSLNQVMGLRLAVDGVAGLQTRSAIRSFQQRQGLKVDGILGQQTEAALISAGAPPPPGGVAPGVGENLSSPDSVRWVQIALNHILGLRLAVDGLMGTQTRSAIRSFQQKLRLRGRS